MQQTLKTSNPQILAPQTLKPSNPQILAPQTLKPSNPGTSRPSNPQILAPQGSQTEVHQLFRASRELPPGIPSKRAPVQKLCKCSQRTLTAWGGCAGKIAGDLREKAWENVWKMWGRGEHVEQTWGRRGKTWKTRGKRGEHVKKAWGRRGENVGKMWGHPQPPEKKVGKFEPSVGEAWRETCERD